MPRRRLRAFTLWTGTLLSLPGGSGEPVRAGGRWLLPAVGYSGAAVGLRILLSMASGESAKSNSRGRNTDCSGCGS